MKKHRILIAAAVLAVVLVVVFVLVHMPTDIKRTLTVSSGTGETAELELDLRYYRNLIFPSYVKGTVTIDGVRYVDKYTKLKEFPSVADRQLFPSGWWKGKSDLPCNTTFLQADCSDVLSAMVNRIDILEIVFEKETCKIHYIYSDDKNQTGINISGISFWGPAQDAGEAEQIAEYFGYRAS